MSSRSHRKVLVIDIGGSNVKLKATGVLKRRKFPSGPRMTAVEMVARVREQTADWEFDVITVGFPAPVVGGRLAVDPKNLGPGWVGFNFARAFGRPVKLLNDAALQALGGYAGGRMLFLGLGTGLGSALVMDDVLVPLELSELSHPQGGTIEDVLGKRSLKKIGRLEWEKAVHAVVRNLKKAFIADYVLLGGGNAKKLQKLPEDTRLGGNGDAFIGGMRLWELDPLTPLPRPPSASPRGVRRGLPVRVQDGKRNPLRTPATAAAIDSAVRASGRTRRGA